MTRHGLSELCGRAIAGRDCRVTFWRHEQSIGATYSQRYGKQASPRQKRQSPISNLKDAAEK